MTADLNESLLAGPDLDLPEVRERWAITDDVVARWAFRKLNAAQAEQARIRADAQAEIDRVTAWAEQAAAGPAHDAAFFTAKLVEYRRTLEAANPKLPGSYKVATGTIKRNPGQPSTKVVEKDRFVAWALTNAPAALKHEPLVSAMADWPRKDLSEVTVIVDPSSGEVVPGVEVVEGDATYSAKPADNMDGPF